MRVRSIEKIGSCEIGMDFPVGLVGATLGGHWADFAGCMVNARLNQQKRPICL